jgi:hypothetical protein
LTTGTNSTAEKCPLFAPVYWPHFRLGLTWLE